MNEDKTSCFDCEHYIASVGEKGYCKLYRHETTLPEISCPRFEKKKEKKIEIKPHHVSEKRNVMRQNVNFLAMAAFFASTVLTVISLLFGLYFIITIFSIPHLHIIIKAVVLIATLIVVLLLAAFLFNIGKKYLVARMLELFFTVFIVVFVLINYDTIWFSFHNLVIKILDYALGVFHAQ